MPKIRPGRAGALLALLLLTGACRDSGEGDDVGLRIVTTVSPITNIAANIAGPDAQVTGLVPEGTNSHTWEPPPSTAKALARADVVFVNGLGLEEPVTEMAGEAAGDAEVVALGDATLPESEWVFDFSFPEAAGRPNPHVWTSPVRARGYGERIMETLVDLDPAHASGYRERFREWASRVDELDVALRAATETVPVANRRLLTYHDSFAYFARDYGWEVVGAIQPSDFEEPTPREVAAVIEQIKTEKVPAVFGSEVFPSPVLAQIGRETGARYVDELRDDDLPGGPGDPAHSYLGLMRFDFSTIVESLGGDPSGLEALDVSDVGPTRAKYPQ